MNRTAILTLIQAAGYGTDAESVAAENTALDAALLELSSEREWSWLLKSYVAGVLTPGNEDVPMPADLAVPKGVRLSLGVTYEPLTEVSADELRTWLHNDLVSDVPVAWAWVDRKVKVYSRPNLAYGVTLDYVSVPDLTTFDTGSEVPQFEGRFHTLLAWGAIKLLAFRQRDQIAFGMATAEWDAGKARLVRADRTGQPRRVVRRGAVDPVGW